MANGPPLATLNHVAADLGIPNESEPLRVGIRYLFYLAALLLVNMPPRFMLGIMPFDITIASLLAILVLLLAVPVVMFARFRLHAIVSTFVFTIFWVIITVNQLMSFIDPALPNDEVTSAALLATLMLSDQTAILIAFIMIPVLLLILLSVAPAKAISRRLIFLALGLLLLIALNELSKLGLDVTAPKLQG
jgi:hypothetical protein